MAQEKLFGEEEMDSLRQAPLTPQQAFKLNTGQQAAIDFLIPFCLGKTDFIRVLLQGFAGTGKTWTINRVVEAVRKKRPEIAFGMTAPTHKAVRQLYKHSELQKELDFGTIHSFLGLKQVLKVDPKDRTRMIETFEPDKGMMGQRKIDSIDVLILDEASMLSDELYEHIDDLVRAGKVRVIFMGDGLQIPPVGKKQDTGIADAIPFVAEQRQSRKIHLLELSEIVRQGAGNPIIEYSVAIRQQYRRQSIDFPIPSAELMESPTGILQVPRNLEMLRSLFRKYFCTEEFKTDPDYMKVIAWRNDTVDYFNREIRLLIYNASTLPRIVDGDKLVLDKPVMKGDKPILSNNEELDVIEHEIVEMPVKYFIIDRSSKNQFAQMTDSTMDELVGRKHHEHKFKVYKAKVKTGTGAEHFINILHEDSEDSYKKIREQMIASAKDKGTEFFEQKEMWKQFYEMEKKFAWTKYNYCLTAHKSQGSTYDYCISMEWDIAQNRDIEERNRIRYVAATRARNKLYIVN